MKSRFSGSGILIATAFLVGGFSNSLAQATAGPADLGVLTGFYRSTQLQSQSHGDEIITIPDYLMQGDVQYHLKPGFAKEVPFVDSFSITRFLGGLRDDWLHQTSTWNDSLGDASLDYVIKQNGALTYRRDMIDWHLRPFLDAGYKLSDITINIENIPWALARDGGKMGTWGQMNPPADMTVWGTTVLKFANDIKALYGTATSPSFKIGNEYDTKKSFNGTAQDYYDYYSISYQALKSVFPASSVVPGEFTGNGTCAGPRADACVYDTKDFLQATAKFPPAYVPRSLNAFGNAADPMPSKTVERAVNSYARLNGVVPEIHQFGLIGQPFGPFNRFGSDQGVRQASWEFQTMMGLKQFLNPQRIFHWATFVTIHNTEMSFINGGGFLRLFLDRYQGMHMHRVSAEISGDPATEVMAVAFAGSKASALIVSSFSMSNDNGGEVAVRIDLPTALVNTPREQWRYIRYKADGNVFAQIRKDLEADNNLKPEFKSCASCTAPPANMAIDGPRMRAMLAAHWNEYKANMLGNLKWQSVKNLDYLAPDSSGKLLLNHFPKNELLILETDN